MTFTLDVGTMVRTEARTIYRILIFVVYMLNGVMDKTVLRLLICTFVHEMNKKAGQILLRPVYAYGLQGYW